MMSASVMFSMSGVNKQRFIEAVKADPQTYGDWSGNGEWDYETTGKEDDMFSPFLRKPFKKALEAGLIPPYLHTIAGTWGTVTDQGDLTYLNLVHIPEIDGTDPADLTRGEIRGRREAIYALEALRKFMPGCEGAKLRNFGMTLGIRDTRKIDALYNLTGADVRGRRASTMRWAYSRNSSTATAFSSCRPRAATGMCPTARWCPRASAICWSRADASAAITSRMHPPAT
jgi:hypothetical protein